LVAGRPQLGNPRPRALGRPSGFASRAATDRAASSSRGSVDGHEGSLGGDNGNDDYDVDSHDDVAVGECGRRGRDRFVNWVPAKEDGGLSLIKAREVVLH
jgi:hypothetical protein